MALLGANINFTMKSFEGYIDDVFVHKDKGNEPLCKEYRTFIS